MSYFLHPHPHHTYTLYEYVYHMHGSWGKKIGSGALRQVDCRGPVEHITVAAWKEVVKVELEKMERG